jgi:hypothetical protein
MHALGFNGPHFRHFADEEFSSASFRASEAT